MPIGEGVLPLKTASIHGKKGEPKMEEGIWLGLNGRTEEAFIGTERGVAKCRTIKRLPANQCWDPRLLNKMEGTTWQPVPGYKSDHVPVEIDEQGAKVDRSEEDNDHVAYEIIPLEEGDQKEVRIRTNPLTDIRVTHRDLDKYGCTPGCPACEYVLKDQKIARGVAHPKECRKRIRDNIEIDEDTQERINRADARKKKHEKNVSHVGVKSNSAIPRYRSKLEHEFNTRMLQMISEAIDVAEIYSPPRIAERAEKWGLEGGWSLDLTTTDKDGKHWDFAFPRRRCGIGQWRK